jgi:hypothetical protein
MANTNAPFGFRPMIRLGGYPWATQEYGKPATDAQAIFMFDLVYKVAGAVPLLESPTGYNLSAVQSTYAAGFTVGTTLIQGASINFGAASTATPHFVTDEIDCIYIAQAKTGTAITTLAHVDKNANISKTTAGSALTKQSGLAVDSGTIATTATLDVKINRVAMISPNAEGDSAILEVLINKHQFGQATVGA